MGLHRYIIRNNLSGLLNFLNLNLNLMASDLEDFADALLIEGRVYNEHDQELFQERTGTASQSDLTALNTEVNAIDNDLDAVTNRVTVTEDNITSLTATVNGIVVGMTYTVANKADLPSSVNGTSKAIFGTVYKDNVSNDNNGTYYQDPGASAWVKVPGDLTGRVLVLENDVDEIVIPQIESHSGVILAELDKNRRPFRQVLDNGKTVINIDDSSIPMVGMANLKDDVKQYFPIIDDYPGWILLHLDKNKRLMYGERSDGTVYARFSAGSVTSSSIASGAVNTVALADGSVTKPKLDPPLQVVFPVIDDYTGWIELHLDKNKRLLYGIKSDGTFVARVQGGETADEVIEARGTAEDLNERLSGTITPAGFPDVEIWGQWNLLSFNSKKAQLRLASSLLLNLGVIGDSWSQNSGRYIRELAIYLQALYGNGGAGFFGFGFYNDSGNMNGCANGDHVSGTRDIGWTLEYNVVNGIYAMDAMHISSNVAGKGVTLNINVVQGSLRIHYRIQPGGGVFRYRIGTGAWTSISTDGAGAYGLHSVTIPATTFTLRIEIESAGTAGVILNGIDCKNNSGIVIHKMALSGGRASNFSVNVNASHWQAGASVLELDCLQMMFGTNEQNQNIPPITLADNLHIMSTRVRAARPLCDLSFISPCINGLVGKSYTMYQYRDAIYSKAVELGGGFFDLIKSFGPDFNKYKSSTDGSTLNLFSDDGSDEVTTNDVHPNPATGGKFIADLLSKYYSK